MNENVHRITPSQPSAHGGGGNGHDLHGRVSVLEAELKHLATKSDIQSIKVWALSGTIAGIVIVATMVIATLKFVD